jgi:hypothetical protein
MDAHCGSKGSVQHYIAYFFLFASFDLDISRKLLIPTFIWARLYIQGEAWSEILVYYLMLLCSL